MAEADGPLQYLYDFLHCIFDEANCTFPKTHPKRAGKTGALPLVLQVSRGRSNPKVRKPIYVL